ncbi:MAG: hypothetical protein EOO57_07390 [Hymenobacter sp.]|nr:MAG: hypothetical protein EOO57_07390 [Hymenobacter sp.]
MHLKAYPLEFGDSLLTFEFVSEGPKGRLLKVIQFTEIEPNIYTLAFGDADAITGVLNDSVVSNNGDSEKVLATVVSAVYAFCQQYPDAVVYATGSTPARTRLYQMGLNRFLPAVVERVDLYGQRGEDWEVFQKEVTYTALAARLKSF